MATGAEFDTVEVGYFGAGQFIPCDELTAGMVGYITASIKNVRDTRVGDTVTDADRPCAEPLPGYKKVNPMVYCGMYPADGAHYADLRDALEKLQLNDASLQYEPETSVALGFGFRCGFLGLLHLEIIQERLEREYELDILVNKEEVDALSFIVHADSAAERGRKMCEKLKDEIPRQLFEIPIQAAIGGRIVARETVRAMRKDVLAKCYGGDISRKKKLLEKQKEGKKRMRQFGNVEIPQKAFMAVLKLDDN